MCSAGPAGLAWRAGEPTQPASLDPPPPSLAQHPSSWCSSTPGPPASARLPPQSSAGLRGRWQRGACADGQLHKPTPTEGCTKRLLWRQQPGAPGNEAWTEAGQRGLGPLCPVPHTPPCSITNCLVAKLRHVAIQLLQLATQLLHGVGRVAHLRGASPGRRTACASHGRVGAAHGREHAVAGITAVLPSGREGAAAGRAGHGAQLAYEGSASSWAHQAAERAGGPSPLGSAHPILHISHEVPPARHAA